RRLPGRRGPAVHTGSGATGRGRPAQRVGDHDRLRRLRDPSGLRGGRMDRGDLAWVTAGTGLADGDVAGVGDRVTRRAREGRCASAAFRARAGGQATEYGEMTSSRTLASTIPVAKSTGMGRTSQVAVVVSPP